MRRASRKTIFAGLDCETTGSRLNEHELIQIGIYLDGERLFTARVGWPSFQYDSDALQAIGVDPCEIPQWPQASVVDAEIISWLAGLGIDEGSVVPVGWGVSGFDVPFVERSLPLFSERYLTHRSVELNAICYTLGSAKTYMDQPRSFDEWKTMAKKVSEFHVHLAYDRTPQWHDAGYDALTSLLAWHWLRGIVRDPWPATCRADRVGRESDC